MTGQGTDYTRDAIDALTAAVDDQHDFCDWLAGVLATVAARKGSTSALLRGRPGSWEAGLIEALLTGTVGPGDDHLDAYRDRP